MPCLDINRFKSYFTPHCLLHGAAAVSLACGQHNTPSSAYLHQYVRFRLQEGPPVIALRPSLDNRMLAVQRSAAMLELVDLASGLCFVHSIHKGRGDILAFFFTDAPDTDMVIVTSRAVELNQFAAR
jgi:hypothetical protein